jgi:hypothetical protein
VSIAGDTGLIAGVDTHRDTHTAAVCDARGRAGSQLQVAASAEGYARLLEWAGEQAAGRPVTRAIEGTRHYGLGRATRSTRSARPGNCWPARTPGRCGPTGTARRCGC